MAQFQDDGFHPYNPACSDRSIWHSPRLWLLRLRSRLLCLSRCLLNSACQSCPALCFSLPGTLSSTGYRFPLFNHSRLSTAIVNIREDSLLSSTSSLATLSQAAVGNRLQGGTSRYNSPLDAPCAGSSFFRKRLSSSSCRCTKQGRGGFLPPHHPGQSLGSGGGVSAPKGSLRAGSALFARLLQPFVFCRVGLGVVAASNYLSLLNLIVLKIHHSEGGVSASSDASGIQMVSSVHGVSAKFTISRLFALVSPRLCRSSRGSWLRFRSFSTVLDSASGLSARLAIQASSRE